MKKNISNIHGFSIVEVLVGIFIFTLGLVSVYAVVESTIKIGEYNKYSLIALQLGSEQLELVRNMRDGNYKTLRNYMDGLPGSGTGTFQISHVYDESPTVDIQGVNNPENISQFQLCHDTGKRYIYCDSNNPDHTPTPLYRYIEITDIPNVDTGKKIRSVVGWNRKGNHEIILDMILTDWRRL
ncbi:prepilin-type N-terminal cleavage/methylation domain-containing protein [Candidatus Gracilibacteria bacterium]|nr:prepilin-type N-terminal cleavage/methylation domain-containing protein [Candidatus Gracilibacteria bacterium]